MRIAALALIGCLVGGGAAAAQKVYEGREAEALRCANTIALTAVALHRNDLIGRTEQQIMLDITFRILDRHVSGSWTEKKRAMEVMRDRRSVPDTLEDYRENAARCLTRFPIN